MSQAGEEAHAFWESQARERRAKSELGSTVPRKMGLNWFMPALVKSSVGSLCGTTLLEGTAVWPWHSKNSMKAARTRSAAHAGGQLQSETCKHLRGVCQSRRKHCGD